MSSLKVVTFKLEADLVERLDAIARARGLSRTDIVRDLIKEFLERCRDDRGNGYYYRCPLCSERFLSVNALVKHFRDVHSREWSDDWCPFCGKVPNLRSHVHSLIEDPRHALLYYAITRREVRHQKPRLMHIARSALEKLRA